MPTVAHIVESEIRKKPFLEEALHRGLINHAALADSLIPTVEKELRTNVTFSAVNMAVRRFAEKASTNTRKLRLFDDSTDITLKSDLVEICVDKNKSPLPPMHARQGDFLAITQGLHEATIITSKRNKDSVQKQLPRGAIRKVISDLSAVTITLPEHSIEGPGLFYTLSKEFFWENINIIEIISTYTEVTLIVHTDDAPRILKSVRELIKKNM